jgi:protein ImuA
MIGPANGKSAKEQPSWVACPATQQEVFGSSRDACAPALALHLAQVGTLPDQPRWLWVQDHAAIRLTGRPFIHGLPPALRRGLVHVAAAKAQEALFAIEEGLRCTDFAFVIGELSGDPRALDFTASRRLSVTSERHGVPLYLVRHDGHPNLSAARRRWRVAPFASEAAAWNDCAPGDPRWQAALFRARGLPPGTWIAGERGGWRAVLATEPGAASAPAPHPVDLAAAPGDRPLADERAA